MNRTLIFTTRPDRSFVRLPDAVQESLLRQLYLFGSTGQDDVKTMKGSDLFRLRDGEYRVVFRLTDDGLVVLAAGHRREVYLQKASAMKAQTITTDLGEKLVVIGEREYLALRARAGDEDAEDEMTVLIAAEAQRDLDEGRDLLLPEWFSTAAMTGNGSVLRGLRKYRDLSQAQVAVAAGITQGHYSDVERGGAVPTIEVLDRISAALDLDPGWMRRLERNRVAGAI